MPQDFSQDFKHAFVNQAQAVGMDYPSATLLDLRTYIKLRAEAEELLKKNSSLKELLEAIRADHDYPLGDYAGSPIL